jgi:hypothetical protein
MRHLDIEQERIWEGLYQQILGVLATFGVENHFGDADYLLVDDNLGPLIDGLLRQYLPPEFRDARFEDSRPGTGFD